MERVFDKFSFVNTLENGINLYSRAVYSLRLKRQVRVVVLQTYNSKGKLGYALLFSTNSEQDPREIYHYYSLRFAIKFYIQGCQISSGFAAVSGKRRKQTLFPFQFRLSGPAFGQAGDPAKGQKPYFYLRPEE